MGILRTDKISGLETPTAVTGSVVFDGTGDYLDATVEVLSANNFTFEMWINTSDTSTGYLTVFEYGQHNSSSNGIICQVRNTGGVTGIFTRNGTTDTSGAGINSPYPIKVGEWNHIAITRDGTTVRLHVNGIYTGSGTWSKDFTATDLRIASARYLSGEHFDGYISNFRMLKGTALYGSADFTVPAHELEVIGDTILLCCNNPDSAGADGTGKTITVNGDAAASTFSPGLTRDFTSGTEFQGVTVFDTQGYFVPPSGTTEQRGRGRGIFHGGYASPDYRTEMDYIQISSQGNAIKFGTLGSKNYSEGAPCGDSIRAINGGGAGLNNNMEYVVFATTSNPVDFGDLTVARRSLTAISNNTRGCWAGGTTNPAMSDVIDYATIASLGNAQDFGNLTVARRNLTPNGSSTRGTFAAGNPGSSPNLDDTIDYITFASTGNAVDFGNLATAMREQGGASSGIRGLIAGGYSAPAFRNEIEYITISTLGNGQDFGDLSLARSGTAGVSNKINGLFGGGSSPTVQNLIDYVTIASTGNAADFGDLTYAAVIYAGSQASDSHGGLS